MNERSIPIDLQPQPNTELCWWEARRCVAKLYGIDLPQALGIETLNCPDPVGDLAASYERIGLRCVVDRPLALATLKAEIDAGRAVEALIEWPDGSGHCILLHGYRMGSEPLIEVADPWYGRAFVPYAMLFANYATNGGAWVLSVGRWEKI